ncbi:MAG: co-chaperone GroES [bacterium]
MTKITPLYDRILIKRVEGEDKTEGGIIIPDTAKEKTQIGVAISVGNGKLNSDGSVRPMNVKINDKVLFGKFSGVDVSFGGQDYLILKEDEVLGIIEG